MPALHPGPATDDPVTRYLATFDRLRARKRWSTDTATFRFVALALGAAGAGVDFDHLEKVATGLRRRARWTSPLKSEIRYVVAAMIVRRGLSPQDVHERVFEARDAFKAQRLPSRGTGPTLAALVLALRSEGRAVPARHVERLASIYRRWRNDHFWLTSANDLPAAALHAGRNEPVEVVTADVERAYARLRELGFRRGNPLQLVSHLLAVDPRGTDAAVQRFAVVAERLRDARERVGSGRYDEVALLALAQETPERAVRRVLAYRDRLRAAKPRPSKDLAFSLAAGIELAEDSARAGRDGAGDLAALQAIRDILDAQQAATIAAISASSAAASSSGS